MIPVTRTLPAPSSVSSLGVVTAICLAGLVVSLALAWLGVDLSYIN